MLNDGVEEPNNSGTRTSFAVVKISIWRPSLLELWRKSWLLKGSQRTAGCNVLHDCITEHFN